jgi:ABC-type amino acid transport system permease subunit
MPPPSDPLTAQPQTAQPQSIDPFTVICIAIVAYLLASIIHEGLSHGVTAAVLGARDLRVYSAKLHLDSESVSPEASRAISIAGPLGSLLVGLLLALYQGNTRSKNAEFRFCLWLTAYVCLFSGAGYLMALSFFHVGDIHGFVKDFDSQFAWRLGLTLLGAVLSFVALFFAGRTMDEFLGRNHKAD